MRIPWSRHLLAAAVAVAVLGASGSPAAAQTIRLREAGTNQTRVAMQVGQVITIEVFADLQGVSSSGISFFITVPEGAFVVSDQGLPGAVGNQPFRFDRDRSLFAGAVVSSNLLLPESDDVAAIIDGQQLDFGAVIGVGSDRNRTGSGVVATFQLVAVGPVENGQIRIDDNPIRETKLVLADGVSEKRFVTTQGMEITVTGLELLDIPDVILQPGQSDSVQIGSLSQYVRNTLSPPDSIRWSFEPAAPESLSIVIDPVTRVVKIAPHPDWRGSFRLVWTALDPQLAAPGQPPLTTTEVSTIIVNNRPQFDFEPGPGGVKRDTVRLVEDRHTYIPGQTTPDPRRAFRGIDLDLIALDPDVTDPDAELNYIVLPLPSGTDVTQANVRGSDADDTHELLIWTRPDFGGTDSLGIRVDGEDTTTVFGGRDSVRVIVRDPFGGTDTLRVIVEVTEVPDGPTILETELEPRISRGGIKRFSFPAFVSDPDTPLDDLILTWVNDPEDHFLVDTTRTGAGELVIEVKGDPTFTGSGRVVIRVADPLDPETLFDEVILFFTSAEALPPDIFPPQIKVPLSPGTVHTEDLDLFVSDPDNDDRDLRWAVPAGTRSVITVDELRTLAVRAPDDFVGFEQTDLTVRDPGGQSDVLRLRIYSSDGRPVTGGLPDLVLDRGQENREFDLDDYYHDANNTDEQMLWVPQPSFDPDNLTVSVDPLTHVVTFFADEGATFGTETVIFRVTDPEGVSAEDTMLVTIRSGGPGSGGAFAITPIPPLEASVGPPVKLLNLHDHILTAPSLSKSSISWQVVEPGRIGIAVVRRIVDPDSPGGVRWDLTVFSDSSGVDTLQFVATDSLGRSEAVTTTIRYFGESERLQLRALPDIVFIAGSPFTGLTLNDFVLDREAHPDSVLEWHQVDIGQGTGTVIVQINDDSSVRALSFDITETEIVFTVRDTVLGVTGRDTVRVISQDPALAARPLQPLPDIVLQSGDVDSSIVLNDFLPEGVEPSFTNWSVSGQSLTVPLIDPVAPHRLRIGSVGLSVGTDTLGIRVDLGGGFVATGTLVVTVIEPVDESTLSLQVVPNPLNANFVDFFVMARTELTSSPTVVVSFEGDTTVAVRQIEEDLPRRGVLIWAGSFQVRLGGAGTLLFRAQAITALGTSVSAQASIAVGTAGSGKVLALVHGGVELVVPAGAVDGPQRVYLQSSRADSGPEPASRPAGDRPGELVRRRQIRVYPAGLELRRPARLSVSGEPDPTTGFYRWEPQGWRWLAPAATGARIDRLGRYGLFADHTPPRLRVEVLERGVWLGVSDQGSGYDPADVYAELDGVRFSVEPGDDGLFVQVLTEDPARAGLREVIFVAADRAGNRTRRTRRLQVVARLPAALVLGANYPNPFNPETAIPLELPAGAGSIRLRIYNAAGQVVRELLNGSPGPGRHVIIWDGLDEAGRALGSGVYYYQAEGAGRVRTRPMTLLK